MPCPQPIGGRPRPSGLLSLVGTCVAAPTGGVNVSTIVGSPRGSSATKARVDPAVSSTPVRVRSTVGPPATVLITGTLATVPVSAKARYSDGVLDRCLGSAGASNVSSTPVEARLEDGPRSPHVGRMQRLPRMPLHRLDRVAQQLACVKSRAPPQLRVADQLAYPKPRSPHLRTVRQPLSMGPIRVVHR